MTVLAVIPARYASSRFPGKPLALIDGEPMIVHVWNRAHQAKSVDQVLVATDNERIAETCSRHGIEFAMTSSEHETGTDRLAEVARTTPADILVNVQGDEPLIEPEIIDTCVDCLQAELSRGIEVSTVYLTNATPEQEEDLSNVHLVPTLDGCVLTFSRLPIPCAFREPFQRNIHIGLYAFTRDALARFASWERGPVERSESIELLRFLEHGERIAARPVVSRSIGVDHPEDIVRVERMMGAADRGAT